MKVSEILERTPLEDTYDRLKRIIGQPPSNLKVKVSGVVTNEFSEPKDPKIKQALDAAIKPFNEKFKMEHYSEVYNAAKEFIRLYENENHS